MTIDIDTITLSRGSHGSREAGMCAMELVAYVANEPHSDHPQCACPVITQFCISLNDRWDDETRNRLLKPVLPLVVGTRSTSAIENQRAIMIYDWLTRTYTPAFLELCEATKADAATVRALPEIVDEASARLAIVVLGPIKARAAAAWDAAWDAARDAASDEQSKMFTAMIDAA